MKLPLSWLREWVDIPWSANELASRLTLAGFEVEGVEPAAPDFSQVVVGEILSIAAHPDSDKLRVCQVDAGAGAVLQIVCGAANARAGLKAPLAKIGAHLPGDIVITAAKLRGVESAGMLCSAREFGPVPGRHRAIGAAGGCTHRRIAARLPRPGRPDPRIEGVRKSRRCDVGTRRGAGNRSPDWRTTQAAATGACERRRAADCTRRGAGADGGATPAAASTCGAG